MSRPVFAVLGALSLFLVVFPLTLGKPGMPPNLKADEAAYYLMASSLAEDRDLRLDLRDVDRAFLEFPFKPVNNLIAMTDDGWQTVYFGKPYLYSLAAAPFVRLFGANGMLAFNMLLLVAMVWMGTLYLSQFNEPWLAALFSAGFFFLSTAFAYAFWLQPEMFNMAGVATALFLVFYRPGDQPLPWWRLALSGAALAMPLYNKPMIAALALPILWTIWSRREERGLERHGRQRRWRELGAWAAGFAVAAGLAVGIAVALTGHPSAYLGVRRQGVTICEPGRMPVEPVSEAAQAAAHSPTGNSWTWIFRIPDFNVEEVAENVGYFLWGRHAGLLLYMPFAALCLILFFLHARRSRRRWVLLAALGIVAAFFLLYIPFNWHGGGGFVGNRYYINVYPGFLFLVTRIRPQGLTLAGFFLGGLLLGPTIFTPFGAGGPEPTLQSHTRNAPFGFFPLELSLRNVPGYERVPIGDARVVGRRDQMLPQGGQLWLRGNSRSELYLLSAEPVRKATFRVENAAPGNRVELDFGDETHRLELPRGDEVVTVSMDAGSDGATRVQRGNRFWVQRLVVETRNGRVRPWTRFYPPSSCAYFNTAESTEENFFTGAVLTYLGSGETLDADLYAVEWGEVEAPAQVKAGSRLALDTVLINRSSNPWKKEGAAEVKLAFHWLSEAGEPVIWDGERTDLPLPVAPGQRVEVRQRIVAPRRAGNYILELDPVFEHVAWFSDRNGGRTLKLPIEVVP